MDVGKLQFMYNKCLVHYSTPNCTTEGNLRDYLDYTDFKYGVIFNYYSHTI